VKIDITVMYRLYSILDKPSVKGALQGMQDAAQSDNALLGALILRNFVSIVKPDRSNLSFYCHHLLWLLSQTNTPFSEESLDKIAAELEQFVPLKRLAQIDFRHIHERIRFTVERGLVSYVEDNMALRAELKEAVAKAIEEMEEIQEKAAERKLSENEYRLNRLIEEIVRNEKFTSRHIERFDKALAGDFEPIVRLITVFARKIAGPDDDVCHVATLLLHHARVHLGNSDHDSVWETIQDEIHASINGSGSELAV
jgi:hypothetical protein